MFRLLFCHNSLPTRVIHRETLKFLEVNEAAVREYGYLREEQLRQSQKMEAVEAGRKSSRFQRKKTLKLRG